MKVVVFIALLAAALAVPVRDEIKMDRAKEVLKKVQKIKDPGTYENMNALAQEWKQYLNLADFADLSEMSTAERAEHEKNMELVQWAQKALEILYDTAKISLVEGAKPTEEQLVALAKRFSAVVRQSNLAARNYLGEKAVMTNDVIDVLKEIAVEYPLKISGNNFLEIFKERLPKVYIAASAYKEFHVNLKHLLKGEMEKVQRSGESPDEASQLFAEYFIDELIALFKSEEAAIEIFKNYGIIIDTLKSASSYDSLQALYNSLARSKRLEAHAILTRELFKCVGKPLSPAEKAEFHEHVKKYLQILKLFFADGQDTSNMEAILDDFVQNSQPVFKRLAVKIATSLHTPEGKQQLTQCILSDDDRKVFKEMTALEVPEFTEAQMSDLRQKNEKVYALVYLLNGIVHVVRNREGLGVEAAGFLKEMVTMPNSMLRVSEFFASPETQAMIEEHKAAVIAKYNGLSEEAKKEFVQVFPYRTVYNLALLD